MIVARYRFGYRRRPVRWGRLPVLAGWIAAIACLCCGHPARSGNGFSSFGHQVHIVYTEGHRSSWNLQQTFAETQYSTRHAGIDWVVRLSYWKPFGDLRWGYFGREEHAPIEPDDSDGGRLSGRVHFFEPSTRAILTAALPEKLAFCRGEVQFRGDDQVAYFGAIGFQPNQFFSTEFRHGRFYPFPSYSELYFTPFSEDGFVGHEGGRLMWKVPASQNNVKLTLSYYGKVTASYRRLDVNLLSEQPRYGDFPMGSYAGQLFGGWLYHEATVSFVPLSGWKNRIGYRELVLDCDSLTAYDGGLKFAYFGIVEGSGHLWSYTASYRSYVLEISRGRAEVRALGTVQAWPFLEGLYHFLGERRHFIAEGAIRWFHASIGKDLWSTSWLNVATYLNYLRVRPDLVYVTWRPYFMGMGADDLRSESLDLQRADLARLQIKPGITWSYIHIYLNVSQWIPIDTRKASDSKPGGDAGDAEPGEKQNIWGGFSASLVITAAF